MVWMVTRLTSWPSLQRVPAFGKGRESRDMQMLDGVGGKSPPTEREKRQVCEPSQVWQREGGGEDSR